MLICMVKIDQLDKKILQHLSEGITSYQELSKQCNTSRNTIYRRIKILEKNKVIIGITHAVINYQILNLKTIAIGITVPQKSLDKLIERLSGYEKIKFLYKSFGTHNLVGIAYCEEEKTGETINDIKMILEEFEVTELCIDVSFTCEKADPTPFNNNILNIHLN
jgi:DNA-binding Lrp family transcriptional regulator